MLQSSVMDTLFSDMKDRRNKSLDLTIIAKQVCVSIKRFVDAC